MKTGLIAFLCTFFVFMLAIVQGLLILDARLLAYLPPGAASFFVAIAVGLVIGWFTTDIFWDFATQMWRFTHLLIRFPSQIIQDFNTGGVTVSYFFLAFMSQLMYGGLHARASTVVSLVGLDGRVAHPATPLRSAVVLSLDLGNAFGAVAMIGLIGAINFRIFYLFLNHLPTKVITANRYINKQINMIYYSFPLSVREPQPKLEDFEPDSEDLKVINDFAARVGLLGLIVAVLSLEGWHSIGPSLPQPMVVFRISKLIAVSYIGLLVFSFVLGVVYQIGQFVFNIQPYLQRCHSFISKAIFTGGRVITLRSDSPLLSTLLGAGFVTASLAIYTVSVTLLPANRSQLPPLLQYTDTFFPAYSRSIWAEAARIGSVVSFTSFLVSTVIRGREWWRASAVMSGYESLQSVRASFDEFSERVMDKLGGLTEEQAPSKWALWVRVTVFAQTFIISLAMLENARNQVSGGTTEIVVLVILLHVMTVFLDIRARRSPLGWREAVWIVVVSVPIVGGLLYVIREY